MSRRDGSPRVSGAAYGRADSRADAVFETVYLILLGLMTLMAFRYTTMIPYDRLDWDYNTIRQLRLVLAVFVGLKLAYERSWGPWELVLAAVLCASLIRSWQRVERLYVFELALLIAGAHGVDYRKILRVWCAVTAAALVGTVALALTGSIENLTYERDGHVRMALGSIYPTDFAAHVFFTAAGFAFLRGRRATYIEVAAYAVLAAAVLLVCDARNSAVCLGLLAGWLLIAYRSRRRYGAWRPNAVTRGLCVASAPVMAGGMIALSRVYTSRTPWMASLNRLLSGRLVYGRQAFNNLPLYLFGSDIQLVGRGGAVEEPESVFFLDSSYLYVLFLFGAAVLAAVLIGSVISALRENRLRSWERLGILAIVSLHCLLEHHMLELSYNVFLLLPLAVRAPEAEDG